MYSDTLADRGGSLGARSELFLSIIYLLRQHKIKHNTEVQ